jgi:hypothetical protein
MDATLPQAHIVGLRHLMARLDDLIAKVADRPLRQETEVALRETKRRQRFGRRVLARQYPEGWGFQLAPAE